MSNLEILRTYAQIITPLAITASTIVALYLGLRYQRPRFKVTMRLRDAPARGRAPIETIDVRNFGTLPVRIKAFYVAGWSAKTRTIPQRIEETFDMPAAGRLWVVEAGREETAPLGQLLGERVGYMWAAWATLRPGWFRSFPRLAHLFWYVGVVTTDGRRVRAWLTREAIRTI